MIALLSIIALILGLVLYLVPANGKVNEIGRIMFFAGVLVALMHFSGRTARLL